MEPGKRTVAMVGAAGGVGTTRLTVELGATLARTGRDVVIVDASFATQGLADYVDGRVDADVTAVLTEQAEFDDALYPLSSETDGLLVGCPAAGPFERLARAKTAGAARRLERIIEQASRSYECVLVDVPPIAGNQAVAAANAAEQLVAVAPATVRGNDAVARLQERLDDLDLDRPTVLANRAPTDGDHPLTAGTAVSIPESDVCNPADAPVCEGLEDDPFQRGLVTAAEAALDITLDVDFPDGGLLPDRLQ